MDETIINIIIGNLITLYETVLDIILEVTAQPVLTLRSPILSTEGCFTLPEPHGVCHLCFAAAPAAPGAAAWLSPAGAARLYSYSHSPSATEAKRSFCALGGFWVVIQEQFHRCDLNGFVLRR